MPLSVDLSHFVMEEEVALEFHSLKDQIREIIAEKSSCTLSKVIDYCKIRVNPSTEETDFDPKIVK